MTVTWFTERPAPGELTVRGPGLRGKAVYTSSPTYKPALDYTEAELKEEIEGLVQGSWLQGKANYKHTVDVRGLKPGHRYRYVVRQGDAKFAANFQTAPGDYRWRRIRFVAMSDSETQPSSRATRREWVPGALADGGLDRPSAQEGSRWEEVFGSTVFSGVRVLRYMLTEADGYYYNRQIVDSRNPDFLLMPGDIVAGGGYQPGWDEFFRYNAGELGTGLGRYPILPSFGNWENFGALNGRYGTPEDRSPVVRARDKYHVYFDPPSNGTPAHRDDYYRIDYGPVTVLTLDSSNGEPDDHSDNYPEEEKATGKEYHGAGTDTQQNFTSIQYEEAGGTDLADFNPGSIQWNWVREQLADARSEDQIIFVQFHHVPYSSGEHGLPMYHALTSGQGGTPMRQYHPMFERFGVVAVFSGHSEMFERSFVDKNGDGVGVQYYDVGVSGDGLRGEKRNGSSLNDPLLSYNPFSQWTADQDEPERWERVNGVRQLVNGGKHYGHLEVNLKQLAPHHDASSEAGSERPVARVTFTPVHVFPILDEDYELERVERRTYGDEVVLYLNSDGQVIRSPVR